MPEHDPVTLLGRILLGAGLLMAAVGLVLLLAPRLPGLGRLPGDIVWSRGNVRIYVPLATSLLLSLILTIILSLVSFFRR
jgi:hypothetical protein